MGAIRLADYTLSSRRILTAENAEDAEIAEFTLTQKPSSKLIRTLNLVSDSLPVLRVLCALCG